MAVSRKSTSAFVVPSRLSESAAAVSPAVPSDLPAAPKAASRFLTELGTSGLSVSIANICTLPMDVVKVRLQLQTRLAGGAAPMGLVGTAVNIAQTEGASAFFKGLSPAVMRGLFYGGARLGCYAPLKDMLGATKENKSLARNVAAGAISGSLASVVSNPIDLIKTRLQSKSSPHKTSMAVVRHITGTEGVLGLWRGTVPAMARASVLTAAQCASYDESKKLWMKLTGGGEDFTTHLGASMITGVVTTTATGPVDVIKTNMFVGGNRYSGPMQCAKDIIKQEGVRGLFRGWTANYARLGPQTTVIFVVMEQIRSMSGLGAL